jgi:predicted ribosome quality control (RQC) complex YloA/Tae2 family protein
LKNAERKITADLKRTLKEEKPLMKPLRETKWFEKFYWFISSEGYLVLGLVPP